MSDFTKPRTINYCDGPAEVGVAEADKFATRWAAWQGTNGVRVGQFASVTLPADGIGYKSTLFPTTKTDHLTISFDKAGLMHIAIQDDANTIRLKYFKNAIGEITNITWIGTSPMLFNNWLLYYSEINPDGDDVVCYYLKPAHPDFVFARFARDQFLTEYQINFDLPADLDYLVSTDRYQGLRQIMLAKSVFGDNVTLTSDSYGTSLREVFGSLSIAFVSGDYFLRAAIYTSDDPENQGVVRVRLESGHLQALAIEDLSGGPDNSTLEISFDQGYYQSA